VRVAPQLRLLGVAPAAQKARVLADRAENHRYHLHPVVAQYAVDRLT